jgi:hypothetical protein
MRESKILVAIRDACNNGATRLWRNSVGTALAVNHKHPYTKQAIISACIKLAEDRGGFAQRMSFGLAEGSGDLIGYRQIVIGPEHVGMTIAQFASCEVKNETGRARPEQIRWLAHINSVGGVAFLARSVEDARQALDTPFNPE